MTDKTALRDAATIVLLRDRRTRPAVLMGQRGAGAAFMPSKYVFPGGAVDAADAGIPLAAPPGPTCRARLTDDSRATPQALAAAAIRELWEETGQVLGSPGAWADAPRGWRGFAATGHVPDASGLCFIFRAVTPPGRPRRFRCAFSFWPRGAEAAGATDAQTISPRRRGRAAPPCTGSARGDGAPGS